MVRTVGIREASELQGVSIDIIYRAVRKRGTAGDQDRRRLGIVGVEPGPPVKVKIDPSLKVERHRAPRGQAGSGGPASAGMDARVAELRAENAALKAQLAAVVGELELRRVETSRLHELLAAAIAGTPARRAKPSSSGG